MDYKRQKVGKYIIKALQDLGGSAPKKMIKDYIANDDSIKIGNVYYTKTSKTGNEYYPFDWDFNHGLKELLVCGYVEPYNRTTNINLTEKGRANDYNLFPSKEECSIIKKHWDSFKSKDNNPSEEKELDIEDIEEKIEDDLVDEETLQVKILELIKGFSPKKFESFSRQLLTKMGIVFDSKKGIQMSGDHGIDGYGYYESDEFRTSIVVIQCKRFTDKWVGEPEINQFRGTMVSQSADYGIFITTSYFSQPAKEASTKVNPKITLIDGQKLVSLIIKYKLWIKEVLVPYYSIDGYYNEKD